MAGGDLISFRALFYETLQKKMEIRDQRKERGETNFYDVWPCWKTDREEVSIS